MKTKIRGNIYKAPETSEEFNNIYNDAAEDIQQLFSDLAETVDEKTKIANILTKENMFLYNKIQSMYSEFIDIRDRIDRIEQNRDDEINKMYQRFNSLSSISKYDSTNINTIYRIATIKDTGTPISRTHLYNSALDELYIPSGLKISVTESTSLSFPAVATYTSETDDTLLNAINNDSVSYFTREVPKQQGVELLYLKVNLKIPQEFVNSLSCNALCINPFPSYSMDLLKVEYKNQLGQTITLFDFTNSPISGIPRINIRFDTVSATDFTLYFAQRPIYENYEWKFLYGFQYLDALYHEILTQESSFVSTFKLDSANFLIVNNPVTEYSILSKEPTEDLVSYQLFFDEAMQEEKAFGTTILADINTVYIKTTIKRSETTGSPPILSGYNFTYMIK